MGAPRPMLPLLLLLLTAAIGRARKCERGSGTGVLSARGSGSGHPDGTGAAAGAPGLGWGSGARPQWVSWSLLLSADRTWAVALQGGERTPWEAGPWEACCQPSVLSPFLTEQEVLESVSPSCSKDATRFKHFRKYLYNYEVESSSGVPGTADSRSTTRINCKVELEVPHLCSFILRTSQCMLREVYAFSPEGKALLRKMKSSEEFAAAMARHELRLTAAEGKRVSLYPEADEPKHILNIKRGIISALLAPLETNMDTQELFQDTVYGNCSTHVTVKTKKGNVVTEMSTERNLQQCEGFQPVSSGVSPLALIKGMARPLSTLISSSQSCQYTLDARGKHVSEATCKEQHLFLPFSYKNKYGMMVHITQSLKLEDIPKINSRIFIEGTQRVGLALENTKATSPPKQAEAVLKTLQELRKLSISEQNAQRANLFNKLVTELRGLSSEAVASLLPQLIQVSSPITLQALVQCGQPQCYTHILQWLKSEGGNPLLIDIATYLLALIPDPSEHRLQEIFNTTKEQQSRATFYALSRVVNSYYVTHRVTQDLHDIADFLVEQIGTECDRDEDHTYLILRAIGNMGKTMEQVTPTVKSAVLKCIQSTRQSLLIQKAAIQALRKMEMTDEVQGILLQTLLDDTSPTDKRLAAYLMLIREASQSAINQIAQLLPGEKNEQVKNFVASHLANILNSEEPHIQDLKDLVKAALEGSQLPSVMDFRKFSRNYQLSKSVSLPSLAPVSAKIEGNLIFDSDNYIPKESMLKTTLSVFGFAPADLFEIGLEGKGFEPTLEALFGKQGFFPDSVNKALYWVDGRVPDFISKVLRDYFGYTKEDKREQDMVNGMMQSFHKLLRDLNSKEVPEARAYLRILGEELGFVKFQDLQLLRNLLLNGARTLQGIPKMIAEAVMKGSKDDWFLHYIFMDNVFELPTGIGLQLQVSSSGVITPGTKAGMKLDVSHMQAELVVKPSVSVEFVTSMGIIIPDFARSGIQMNTNFFHESGLETRVALKSGQLKFIIPSPKGPVKLFSASNSLHLISTTKTEVIPPLSENRQSWSTCRPFFTGLNYCITGAYSNASSTDSASYYPLTGDTRFELELTPTGEVEQYSASATYELKGDDAALVDTLTFVTQAEGVKQTEAIMMFKYNRQSRTLSSAIQIPDFNVDLGTILRLNDESEKDKKSYKLTLDIQNKKITEVTLMGHVSCDMRGEGKIKGVISIPRLQAEARSEILTHWSLAKLLLQMDSSATAYGSTLSKRVAWRYDNEKIEFEWNAGTNVDTKKLASNFPVDLSDYPSSLHVYANSLLDYRVPQTDMTFRHVGSKLILATNTWLQEASQSLPYAQTLQYHLSGLQELNLQKMGLPDFHIPENLFLKSDGRVKYTLNKNVMTIDIPLPLGGKSSKDLKLLETIRTPALNFHPVGFYLPPKEFQVPTFTIPKLYQLRVPLLGVLDLSTNIYSNVYNWSASYTGGNTSADHFSLQARYRVKADSVVDLFSYSVQGSGETTYDHRNTFTLSCDGALRHKFLHSNFKFSHVEKVGSNPASKGFLTFDASSAWGPQMSASVYLDSKKKQHLYIREVKMDGQFRASSFYAKGMYGLSCRRDLTTGWLSGESNLKFNSSYFEGTNQIIGRYEDGTLSLTSTSDLQGGIFKNSASLKYENYELTLKSDANGKYEDFATSNKLDLTLSKENALLRAEYQADYKSLRFFALLSGLLNSQVLELNADILGTDKINTAAHKATLRIGQNGISTSATTSLRYSPLMLENELNAELALSGASVKLITNGRFKEHNAKFSLDGKAALTEVSLGSAYQAMILGADSKNVFNFKISQEGLKLSNDMMGSYAGMKFDYTNNLNIAGLSLDLSSKSDNIYSSDKFYKQNFNFQLQPYSLVTTLNSDLKYSAFGLTSSGKLRLEPLKLNMAGDLKGFYHNDEIKHGYIISYADLSASYKAETVAKVQGVRFNHRINTDIGWLVSSADISTNYNSDSLHFNNIFHSVMGPFSLTIDSLTNGNGKLVLWGEHTGKLYSKFVLKAEPLAFTFSHDYQGSLRHHLLTRGIVSTTFDHKINALLSPTEQKGTWKLKTQINNNEYSQDFEAYNNKDKIGVELKGGALVDLMMLDYPIEVPLLLREPINIIDALELRDAIDKPQEFTIVYFIKYDKNQDVHTINLPFLNSLLEYFERNRMLLVTALETIQGELKRINVDQFVRSYRATLGKLPQQANDYLNALNWEKQVLSAKEKLTAFTKNYKLTDHDLQSALDNAKINLNEKLSQLQTYVIQFDQYIKDNYDLRDFKIAIAKIIDQIIEKLKILDEHYHLRVHLVKSIHNLYLLIENIDFKKTESSAASWIQNVDTKYQIRIWILETLQQLKTQIQNIDIPHLAGKLKQQIEALDVTVLLAQLRTTIPFHKISDIIEYVKYFVINLIENFEITENVKALRATVLELIKKYEVNQQIKEIVDRLVELAHQYKLNETIQKLSNVLQGVEIQDYFEKLVGFVDDAVIQLKALTFEKLIEEVNRFLDLLVKKLKSFDYHQFVDETNNKIREVTQKINYAIQALEIAQKAEALKLFVDDVKAMVLDCLEKLKDTKVTLVTDWLQDALNSISLIHVKAKFVETLEDIRDRVYQMDIQQELMRYLSLTGQAYSTLVTYISDWWRLAAKNLTDLAEQYSIQDWAENLKALVEQGFTVPKIQTTLGTMPAFEISLRALQEATFHTPEFIVPFTDLRIPSVQINFKELKDIKIPSRFSTPEFTILNTFHIPSFTIDLAEIKVKIIRTIDQMLTSELQWPIPEVYLKDLKLDSILARITLPDFHLPEITVPEFTLPNLSFKDLQVPDLHIPEFKLPHFSNTIKVPTFGKLYGGLKIQSPLLTLDANADIKNGTASAEKAVFTASVAAKGESRLEVLNFDFQANAQLSDSKINPWVLKESMKFSSKYLRTQHESELLIFGNAIEGKSDTVASLHTARNTLELHNAVMVKMNTQLALESSTNYSHTLSIPNLDFSSQADLQNEIKTLLEAGYMTWTSSGTGTWKWACPKFSDEGTHESQISFTMTTPITSFGLSNKINSKYLKVNQNVAYNSGLFNFSKFEIQSQIESQYLGHSILTAKGTALLEEGKAEMNGNHVAHLNGKVSGTLKNSLSVLAQPFEITASMNNEGNLKVGFPLKLTGKIDFLNNYALLLSPRAQQASWQASARFNQYKYNHNFSAGNNENSLEAHIGINGDANLDFLNIPLTIPEMNIPYTTLTTPPLRDYSLWEQTGLKEFLKTTKQSFDLSVKAKYKKNKEKHSIAIPLGTLYKFISQNINSFGRHIENSRNDALDFLTRSYNEAKLKFDKYKVENSLNRVPRTFQTPGYTIPIVNIEVSPLIVQMSAFSHLIPQTISTSKITILDLGFNVPSYTLTLPSIELPVLHIPKNLLKISFPDFEELKTINNIFIPAMGNITYDFSFKSTVITLNTNAGLYNQSDIVAHFLSSSSSVIEALQYKLEGTSSLTRKRGLKLATALSLNNKFLGGTHDSTISLTKKSMDVSLATSADVHIPTLRMNFKQELTGNTKSKPIVSSSIELKYDFNSTKLHSTVKGAVKHKLNLESLTSYFSIESSTGGDIKGSFFSREYSGTVASEANTYLNPKGTRSSVKLHGASRLDDIWNLEVKENFAGEATFQRIYAMWEHNAKNSLQLQYFFYTHGEQMSKATLELSPWTMSALVQVRGNQPNHLLDIPYFGQDVGLNANFKNQQLNWKSEVQFNLGSLQNKVQFSNNPEEARLDIAGSLEGHLAFLKTIILPVYDKSVWDLMKLDVTTSTNRRQYLRASTALVYTKNPNGYAFSLPVQELADKFIIPWLKLNDPNSVFVTPMFQVPFTDLLVPSYKLDFNEIKIYKKISTSPFALNLPILPNIKFSEVDVLTKYSGPQDASVPFFEITVPEFQVTVSQLTFPKSIPVGSTVLNLNEVVNKIAEFELPSITGPEQTIQIPSTKLSVPAGIFIPFFGTLTTQFGLASPLYNATWSAGLKNKEDHVETFLDSTCSSTIQFLEYDLNVVGTHKMEDGVFICETKGTFAHRDFSAEYKEGIKYKGLWDWEGESRLDVTSPALTDFHMYYHRDDKTLSFWEASPAVGTIGMDLESGEDSLKWNFYFYPQSSPAKKLNILKTELRYKEVDREIQIEAHWEKEAASRLIGYLQDNVPKAVMAFHDYVSKYHQEHTGLSLRDASLRLRRSLHNSAEQAYQEAMRQTDEMHVRLQRAASSTTRTYQEWQDKAQTLYQELLAQEDQMTSQRLKQKVVDSLVWVFQEYHKAAKRVIDSFFDFLKFITFQLPGKEGMYTGDELCTMVLRKMGKVLSQMQSGIHTGLEMLLSYTQDLVEKSKLTKDLIIRHSFDSKGYKLTDLILACRKLFEYLSQEIQKAFNKLQSATFTEILNYVQDILEGGFQNIEKEIKCLKDIEFTDAIHDINVVVQNLIPYGGYLKENLYLNLDKFNEFVQNKLKEAYQELQKFQQYIKALHEEYFDPSLAGWTEKYYELEEKIINVIHSLVAVLKDLHSKFTVSAAGFASQLSNQVEQFMHRDIQEYLSILTDADGKRKEKIAELSSVTQEIIKNWATVMKEIISDYHQQFRYKLQHFSDLLSNYPENFIAESKRLINQSIQSCHMFLSYIVELLMNLRLAIGSEMSPHIKLAPEELTINFSV
ncbi:apolipoprotein B-100 [Ochotona princeps]|uniref:apolipoprotein B-100 n=1 Tax=Ochotona princeps TaxID=9978 RepID=UPI002715555D|nr:apolipoprotein B-100 [Ochotona princeps]